MLNILKKIIPKKIFSFFQPYYHFLLAIIGAVKYGFPSKKMAVIGVTGTKGKTTTTEIVNAILEEAGYKTALASTLRFKIGEKEERNLFKMTMPGRFFLQNFLKKSLDAGCTHVVMEMTSEGSKQFRHRFIYPNVLIFTNLSPEHIESHGSYENYREAKLNIARELTKKIKKDTCIIANTDDKEGEKFLEISADHKFPYSLKDATGIKSDEKGSVFQIGKVVIHSKLPGLFNVSNMLGAIACARFFGIQDEVIKKGLENMQFIRGRMEKIDVGQDFDVVVDYAHTPDSLKAIYETYKTHQTICILGNTGGGRDTWKRPEMGRIADKYCNHIILTNEDPYDESPTKIVEEIKKGIKTKPTEIIMDRRMAIKTAVEKAFHFTKSLQNNQNRVAVLITGKGTDPYIMGPNGSKEEWDDATVAREELNKVLGNS
jgi:UDP-N-acetylmuramoyl-L-alanyl-D-glutamate--2,6-diaminopimelate ligase